MNKMKKVLWMLACLCLTTGASAQMQSGIVRTLERPGKPSEYLAGPASTSLASASMYWNTPTSS